MNKYNIEDSKQIIEIIGISSKSFDDANIQAIRNVSESAKNISGLEVINHMGNVEDGKIKQYKVNIQFALPVV